jgi:hypothetical protein
MTAIEEERRGEGRERRGQGKERESIEGKG